MFRQSSFLFFFCFLMFFNTKAKCDTVDFKKYIPQTAQEIYDNLVPSSPKGKEENLKPVEKERHTVDVVGRVAFFTSQSKLFREIYGDFNLFYQGEITFFLLKYIRWWNNCSYFHKKGKSDPLRVPTTLSVFSVSSGLKYVFFFPKMWRLV